MRKFMSSWETEKKEKVEYTPPEELAALKDLLEKKEITLAKYNKEVSNLQQENLMGIIYSNGGYRLSKKQIKLMQNYESLAQLKERNEATRAIMNRDQFVEELKNQLEAEKAEQSEDSPPNSV